MFHAADNERHSRISAHVIISALVFLVVLCYLGWVFWSRAQADRAFQERAAAAAAQQREQDRETFNGMGGDQFAILNFYASPESIARGDKAELCYSVSNAKSVTLNPPAGEVWPSFSRCLDVSPRKTTRYTLTITNAAG